MTEPTDHHPSGLTPDDSARAALALLDQLAAHQERRLFEMGRPLYAGLSRDDLLAFDDVPALARDLRFVYEAGHYAGLLAARAAFRALLRARTGEGGPG